MKSYSKIYKHLERVSETFSPPRFTDKCHSFGLLPGYAIDLETGWNLLEKTQILSLVRSLEEEEDPYVVTGSHLVDRSQHCKV